MAARTLRAELEALVEAVRVAGEIKPATQAPLIWAVAVAVAAIMMQRVPEPEETAARGSLSFRSPKQIQLRAQPGVRPSLRPAVAASISSTTPERSHSCKMAYFAQVDSSNVVQRVISVNDVECLDQYDNENEAIGALFCHKLLGGIWLQTSFNARIRGKFAGIGDIYDPVTDTFNSPPE